jgi:hypothetical protein
LVGTFIGLIALTTNTLALSGRAELLAAVQRAVQASNASIWIK